MTGAKHLLRRTKEIARSVDTWADLSNALFNPMNGLITTTFPTREERQAFKKTAEYKKIRELLTQSIKEHGLVEGATPRKSGRFVVRVPRSLHSALEREAQEEGVSLNQLVVAKLALQLGNLTGLR